ncbi:MAG: hypothetical protein LBJ00_11890 [Planctomycetaceae bacterium]|nr:hypothetical protein [Planctomycetaceae bacterium]
MTFSNHLQLLSTLSSGLCRSQHGRYTSPSFNSIKLYSSCFKIPEAVANLQRRALGKRNNVKRLFRGEAYRLTGYGINRAI